MGKKDEKVYRNQLNQTQQRNNQLFGQVFNPIAGSRPEIQNRANNERSTIWKGYTDNLNKTFEPIQANTGMLAQNYGDLRELGLTGGMSEEDKARFRGTGFQEFADTGGYNANDLSRIRRSNLAPIRGLFATGMNDMRRNLALSGGYSPGYSAGMAKFARETGKSMSDAALAGELGLKEKVNEGRKWGITGLRDTENALQDILTRTKLGGLTGATGAASSLADAETRLGLANKELEMNNRLGTLGGMKDLYTSNSGELRDTDQLLAGLLGTNLEGGNQILSGWQNLANSPGVFDKIMQGVGTVGGLVSPFMGGLGKFGRKSSFNPGPYGGYYSSGGGNLSGPIRGLESYDL